MIREQPVGFAPPENVILWKLKFLREGGGEKHLRDIRGMVEVSGLEMDFDLLNQAVRELGLEAAWAASLESQGPR